MSNIGDMITTRLMKVNGIFLLYKLKKIKKNNNNNHTLRAKLLMKSNVMPKRK